MSLSGAMGVTSLVLCVAAGAALLARQQPPSSPAPKRLLVAVDASGRARELELLKDEPLCLTISTAPAWPALYQLKTGERFECGAEK